MDNAITPQSFEDWYHCITVKCAIDLTANYIDIRIQSLEDQSDFRTKQFIQLYGDQHYQNVLAWFYEAKTRV